jgi:hypothetical protein
MYDIIDFNAFNDWFMKHRPSNFSYEGRKALFDYLEDIDAGNGICDAYTVDKEPIGIKFDPIAICCEFSEYENFEEIKNGYSLVKINNIDDLRYHTNVIEIDDSDRLIIQDF